MTKYIFIFMIILSIITGVHLYVMGSHVCSSEYSIICKQNTYVPIYINLYHMSINSYFMLFFFRNGQTKSAINKPGKVRLGCNVTKLIMLLH